MAEGWLHFLPSMSAHGGGVGVGGSMPLKTKQPNHIRVPSHSRWQNWEGCCQYLSLALLESQR